MENKTLPRNFTKSLQTNLQTPHIYWAPEITKKIREEFIYLYAAAFNSAGSGCVRRWVGLVPYRLIGKGCLTYGGVGKGTLSFRGVSTMS